MALGNSRRRSRQDTPFLALSDLMTALMLIFLFIMVAFFRILPDKDILAKTSAQNEVLQKHLNAIVAQRDSLQELLNQASANLKTQSNQKIELSNKLESLQQQINSLSQQIVDLQSQKVDLLTKVNHLTDANNLLTIKNATLNQTLASLTASNTDLHSQSADLATQLDAIKKLNTDLTKKVTDLTVTNSELSQHVTSLNQQNDSLTTQFADYKHLTLKAFEGFKQIQTVRAQIYSDLKKTFEKNDFARYGVTLSPDLTIKFNETNAVFPPGSADIRPAFAKVLNKLLPAYYNVLLKYKDSIRAVRIEGHTDPTNFINSKTSDPFIGNLVLSSERATAVLEFLRNSTYFTKTLNQNGIETGNEDRDYITFWTTASGYSYSHDLDNDRQLTFYSKNPVNNEYSRRVEIHVVTADDSIVQKLTKNLDSELKTKD